MSSTSRAQEAPVCSQPDLRNLLSAVKESGPGLPLQWDQALWGRPIPQHRSWAQLWNPSFSEEPTPARAFCYPVPKECQLSPFTIVLLDIWVPDTEKLPKEVPFCWVWVYAVELGSTGGKGQKDNQREEKSWAGRERQRKILRAPGKETMGQGEGIKRTTSFSASHPCSLSYSCWTSP